MLQVEVEPSAEKGDVTVGLSMTVEERERFLADVHVGVLSVERPDGPPLTVPIWYDYRPGGDLWVLTTADSHKGRLLQQAGRFSLCVQDEIAAVLPLRQRRGARITVDAGGRRRAGQPSDGPPVLR